MYSLPTWVLGVLVVGLAAAVSGLGFLVVHRLVPIEVRQAHNDIAGYLSNIAAFVYAVMLALLVAGVWEDYGKAKLTAQIEASAASDVFRAAEGYPEAFRRRVREGIRAYVDIVLGEEWALQARGRMNDVGWRAIEALHRTMLDFEPHGPREQVVHTEELRQMNTLIDQRRLRILMGAAGLQPVVWAVVLVGSALTVSFGFFLGTANVRAHVTMMMMLGAIIGLGLFLLIAMDYPFRGGAGIGPEAFERIHENIRRAAGE
jgi:hypothetical protein